MSNLVSYKKKDRRKSNLAVDLKDSGNGTSRNIIYLAGPLIYHLLALKFFFY